MVALRYLNIKNYYQFHFLLSSMKFQAQKEYFLTCFVDVIDAVEVVDVSEQNSRLHH